MRKLKYLLLTLLALALIVTGLALTVSAETVTEVATADALVTALNDAGVASIKLTADIDIGETALPAVARALTIDLNGYTLSAKGTADAIFKLTTARTAFAIVNTAETQAHINSDRVVVSNTVAHWNPNAITINGGTGGIKFGHSYGTETANTGTCTFQHSAGGDYHLLGNVEFEYDTDGYYIFQVFSGAGINLHITDATVKVYPTATRANTATNSALVYSHGSGAAGAPNVTVENSTLYLNRTLLLHNGYWKKAATITAEGSTFIMGDSENKTKAPNATLNSLLYSHNHPSYSSTFTFTNCSFVGDNILIRSGDSNANGDTINFTECKFELAAYAYSPATSTILNYNGAKSAKFTDCKFKGYSAIANKGTAGNATTGTFVTGANTVADRPFVTDAFVTIDGLLGSNGFDLNTHEMKYTFGPSLPNYAPLKQSTFATDTSIFELLGSTSNESLDFVTSGGNSYADFNYADKYTEGTAKPIIILNHTYTGASFPQFDKYVSYDFDISSNGNGYLDTLIHFVGSNHSYIETYNADGTTTISSGPAGEKTDATGLAQIRIKNGVLSLYAEGSESYTLPTAANEWTHITVLVETVDNGDGSFGGVQSLFVNGELLASFEDDMMFGKPTPDAWSAYGADGVTPAAGATRTVDAWRYTYIRFAAQTDPKYDEETLEITSKENLLIDNLAAVKYTAASDIGEAVENGATFAAEDAVFQPNYTFPEGMEAVATFEGNDYYSAELLNAGIEKAVAANPELAEGFEILLKGDLYNFVVNYPMYVETDGHNFTYYSETYAGENDGEGFEFFEADVDYLANVNFLDANGEVVKTVQTIRGNTLLVSAFVSAGDAELTDSNNYYETWTTCIYPEYVTVAEEDMQIEPTVETEIKLNLKGVKYNLETKAWFSFNIFVPYDESVANVVLPEGGERVTIGGVEYVKYNAGKAVWAYNTSENSNDDNVYSVTVEIDGVEYTEEYTFNLDTYFESVLTTEPTESEKALILSAVNYCNEVHKLYCGEAFEKYEAILNENNFAYAADLDAIIAADAASLPANDADFNTYFTSGTYYYDAETLVANMAIVFDSANYQGDGTDVVFYFENRDGSFTESAGMKAVLGDGTEIIVAHDLTLAPKVDAIRNAAKIVYTTGDGQTVVGYYNLASYVQGTDAEFAKALYDFAMKTEAYKG